MDLKEFLFREEISVTKFAEKIGMSRGHLTRIKNRKMKPSRHLARSISVETGGKVTLEELLKD